MTEPIFIVGCSRSGTTLLHSLLAQQRTLSAFPESNVLFHALDDLDLRRFGPKLVSVRLPQLLLGRYLNQLGFTLSFPRTHFQEFLTAVSRPEFIDLVPDHARRMQIVYRTFELLMNTLADGKRWLEKSPQNIFCIDYIEKYFPTAAFLHIVRNGPDNIASLIDAAEKHSPFAWRFSGPQRLEKAIAYWNNTIKISQRYHCRTNHKVLRYEDLATDPQGSLIEVGQFLRIEIAAELLTYEPRGIVRPSETWKCRPDASITPARSKFQAVFDQHARQVVLSEALDADRIFPRTNAEHCR